MTHSSPLYDQSRFESHAVRAAYLEAIRICETLTEAGHQAFFAGGCVRDALLGRQPKDFDVATDATPDRVREIFGRKKTLAFGASFGVIGVLPAASSRGDVKPEPTEVATFRSDGEYSDGRRPDQVHFGDAENDALRRDFTINGLFFDPIREEVIDYVGGQSDLQRRCLRTIGEASQRFEEDKLRMLRAVRFATTLEFDLDPAVLREIQRRADEIRLVSSERIGAEMRRVMVAKGAVGGLRLLQETKLALVIFAELEHADLKLLERVFHFAPQRSFVGSLSLVCESIRHADSSSDLNQVIESLADQWRLSNEELRQVSAALEYWSLVAESDQLAWSVVQPVLTHRDVEEIVA
ncbi:MAG: CCA tRNA nucleotidyltransferase, partial [Planctomycetota bacterium]